MDKHHIESIFDEMIEDIRNIKMSSHFIYKK